MRHVLFDVEFLLRDANEQKKGGNVIEFSHCIPRVVRRCRRGNCEHVFFVASRVFRMQAHVYLLMGLVWGFAWFAICLVALDVFL